MLALLAAFVVLLVGASAHADARPWFVTDAAPWTRTLSAPTYAITFEYDVGIRTRDGVRLSANIWRPRAAGKFPVILIVTPYNKSSKGGNVISDPVGHATYFVPRGYVVAAVDVRGRHGSQGSSYFFWHREWRAGKFDGLDVDDCLTWLGRQPWSSGKIGMTGGSGLAFEQWMGAQIQNPHLAALVPYVSPDDHYVNFFPGGAFRLSAGLHTLGVLSGADMKAGLMDHFWDWPTLYRHLPLRTADEVMLGRREPFWQDFMDHPDNDAYWRVGSIGSWPRAGEAGEGRYARVRVPTLNVTGWHDTMLQPTINNYTGMVVHGPASLRRSHHLIVGPWFHPVGTRTLGGVDFGPDAAVDFYRVELRWFDYWLKGIDNGLDEEPPVHVFVTGDHRWRALPAWPVADARPTRYFLRSGGHANSRFGDGTLHAEAEATDTPTVAAPSDRFTYDPADPVPTVGGNTRSFPLVVGPADQRVVQTRRDVLVYTGPPLDRDLEISGRILCRLFAASTNTDTDFTAKLVDVHPDGEARILTDGIIRARYRDSFTTPSLIEPGRVYAYTIDLWSASHVFRRGHRIQLEIASSNFPKYDRNPNTGGRFGADTEWRVAEQTVLHDRRFASHLVLPVVSSSHRSP